MVSVSDYRYLRMFVEVAVLALLTLAAILLLSAKGGAQTPEPAYREYRGVSVGIRKEQVRQKLGTPGDVSDRQDFYAFSGVESAQVFYDAAGRVTAVSVNYLGEESGAPPPEKVFGVAVSANEDGSIYKLVRYERAGYLVVYSRSGGDAPPLVTVTMQKLVN